MAGFYKPFCRYNGKLGAQPTRPSLKFAGTPAKHAFLGILLQPDLRSLQSGESVFASSLKINVISTKDDIQR